jgi:hypothetical protein
LGEFIYGGVVWYGLLLIVRRDLCRVSLLINECQQGLFCTTRGMHDLQVRHSHIVELLLQALELGLESVLLVQLWPILKLP